MTRLVLRCPAKVNLHLEVLGLRPDGFHEVRTLLAPVGLWDELEVEVAPAGVVEVHVAPPGVALPQDNSVWRAAQRLLRAFPGAGGARVLLRKRIPVAAGLGGGSSDGAATLVALSKLWDLPLEPSQLASLAGELGSDVPFFLWGGACWGSGRGEVITPLPDLPPYGVVLIPGKEPVPTPAVYQAWDAGWSQEEGVPLFPAGVIPQPHSRREGSELEGGILYDWLRGAGLLPLEKFRNDLQAAACNLFPWIARHLEELRRFSPLLAMVSGSGGTVFGLFGDEGRAAMIARELGHVHAVAVPLLTRQRSQLLPMG